MTIEYLQFDGQNRLRKISLDNYNHLNYSSNETRRWSTRENDRILDEIAQRQQNLRKTSQFDRKEPRDQACLHDRLMSEIKQQRILKPIGKYFSTVSRYNSVYLFSSATNQSIISTTSTDSSRKRIRPVKVCVDNQRRIE